MIERSVDLVLEWCSILGSGSRTQFNRACIGMWPETNPNKVLAAFELMGHLEVDWEHSNKWSVNPLVLAAVEGSSGNAVLVGGRNESTRRSLKRLSKDIHVTALAPNPEYPTAIYIGAGSSDALVQAADELGATPVFDLAARYMDRFAGLDEILASCRVNFAPSGFQAQKLDVTSLRFQPVDVKYANWPSGCFQQLSRGRLKYIFVDDENQRFVTDRWVAVHAEIRRVRRQGFAVPDILRWAPSRHLACLSAAQLPTQWARAAVLCSGLPPRRVRSMPWTDLYPGVRMTMFGRLCDELEVPKRSDDLSRLLTEEL